MKTTIILGGHELTKSFKLFSRRISKLISGDDVRDDDDDDDETESQHYQQLLKSIKLINTCFNISSKAPAIIGECGFDCIVERVPDDEIIVIIQHVKNLHKWDIITGVMVIRLSNENSSFAVDQTITTTSHINWFETFYFVQS
ncbi:unnamed protein product [Rotaria socialis]|uniref:Uncharacterized protein n=2 Tax=Rotaria socialis TaxID=392032 RepID=A0A821FEN0_9BILA|nr:unnamed protein product [Rotaria socialis]CAF3360009.1 unnamed protein product [Rotaria socialis]CAF3496619.1 unnamed protein product [Rotaria socialis]CAF4501520.1 unnamed protein product [Rotaria socialis]CAF4648225.1 unnamed protein product [Rotaria socialis]